LPLPVSWTNSARVKDCNAIATFELTFFRR
jgi:hypothetical protein